MICREKQHGQEQSYVTNAYTTYKVVGERRDLLDAGDDDIVDALVLALLEERVVHLTGTQDVSPNLLGRDKVLGVGVGDVALEVSLADHVGEVGTSLRVAEQRF